MFSEGASSSLSKNSSPRSTKYIKAQTVLIVEDCYRSSKLMSRIVSEELGCNAIVAKGGHDALTIIENQEIDLILLDIMMPTIDGYAVLEKLKSQNISKDIPVIIITGIDTISSAVKCIEMGAEDYLTKPFEPIILKARMISQLEKKCLRNTEHTYLAQIKRQNEELEERIDILNMEIRNRHIAEASLVESKSRFRTLSNATFEGIVIQKNNVILDLNDQFLEMFGVDRKEAIGKNIFDFVEKQCHAPFRDWLGKNDNKEPIEFFSMTNSGTSMEVIARSKDILFDSESSNIIVMSDISERKKNERNLIAANEEAKNATELKDKFVSLVTHNLRSPLSSIIGLLGIVLKTKTESDRNHDLLNRSVENAQSLISMVSKLLDLSKLQSGKIIPTRRVENGNILAVKAIFQESETARKKNIKLINNIPPSWNFVTDENLFNQALFNLLSNAIKFSEPGSKVIIELADKNGTAIAVIDYGCGMSKEVMADIFDDQTLHSEVGTAGEKGSGIGLSLSMELMTAIGGSISVDTKEGVGSSFYLELPKNAIKILIAEDDDDYLIVMKEFFNDMDAEIILAQNGKEALEAVVTFNPDIIITDCNMPSIDGFQLIDMLRNEMEISIPVIAMTANTDPTWKKRALSLGANDFLLKPLEMEGLLENISNLVGNGASC